MQTRNVLPPAVSVFPSDDLEALTVRTKPIGSLAAEPNPFRADSRGVGSPTVSWMTYGASRAEIHVNAPDGPIFARRGPGRFSQKIGPRGVRDGTKLYLQDVSGGLPLTPENTIAVITLRSDQAPVPVLE